MKTLRNLLLLIGIFLMCSSLAIAATIDLNDFCADPTVNVSYDGFSATLEEDPPWVTVLLSNDPYLGDPLLPFPSEPFILSFDYEFTVASNNHDEFYVKLFDADSYINIHEFLIEYDNSTGNTSWNQTGTVSWSVAGAPSTGLGLEFQLSAWDDAADSSVQVSNVIYNVAPIPEPTTFLLMALGLFGLAGLSRKKSNV